MLVDSHCHLDFPDFADDLTSVVDRAGAAGVGVMLSIGTRLSRFGQVRAVAERFPQVFCSVGVHPHEAATEGAVTADELVTLAAHPKVVAFGETGLDYYYDKSPRDRQQASFRAHIEAGRRAGLPVIVHTRDADDDTIAILADEMKKGRFTGLIHCFSSGAELARQALDLGFFISISGIVTFNKAESLRDTVATIPVDRLLVETDCPYLSPVPFRGKRNESAHVVHTATKVAELKGIPVGALADATTANFHRLFTKVGTACGQ